MKAISYLLHLEQPVLATDVQGEPNSAISMPYISGSLLRGALVAAYLHELDQKTLDMEKDDKARRLFLGDRTRHLNAYPFDGKQRALPLPASWCYQKSDIRNAGPRLIHNLSEIAANNFPAESIRTPFVWLRGSTAEPYSPPRQVNIHTQRDAEKGRSTEESGAVYRYDALAEGLTLQGVILTDDDLAADIARLLDQGTLWLGRARRAGYGQVSVSEIRVLDNWFEAEPALPLKDTQPNDKIQITFASDALLRDEKGHATLDPRMALARKLGLPPGSLGGLESNFTFVRARVIGGFNRKWGLPLPQTRAIASGSVFVYEATEPIASQALANLLQEGIGERRGEGFGRVLVNWHLASRYQEDIRTPGLKATALLELSASERAFGQVMADRLMRQHLDRTLQTKVNSTSLQSPCPLSNSQMSRLRLLIRKLLAGHKPGARPDWTDFNKYLSDAQGRRSTKEQFARTIVIEDGHQSGITEWLKAQADEAIKKWSTNPVILGKGDVTIKSPLEAGLAEEYSLRLIDGVLYRATKEATR